MSSLEKSMIGWLSVTLLVLVTTVGLADQDQFGVGNDVVLIADGEVRDSEEREPTIIRALPIPFVEEGLSILIPLDVALPEEEFVVLGSEDEEDGGEGPYVIRALPIPFVEEGLSILIPLDVALSEEELLVLQAGDNTFSDENEVLYPLEDPETLEDSDDISGFEDDGLLQDEAHPLLDPHDDQPDRRQLGRGDQIGDWCNLAFNMPVNRRMDTALEVANDEDFFRVTVPGAGRLVVQTTGSTNTKGMLIDNACRTFFERNNNDGTGQNFLFSHDFSKGQTVFVRVELEAGRPGNYSLTVQFQPSSGGSGGGNSGGGGGSTDGVGDTCGTAKSLGVNKKLDSAIDSANDEDFFRVTVPGAGRLVVQTTGSTNTKGMLIDNACRTFFERNNNDGTGQNFLFSHDFSKGQTVFVRVELEAGRPGNYSLTVQFQPSSGGSGGGNSGGGRGGGNSGSSLGPDEVGNTCNSAHQTGINGANLPAALQSSTDIDVFRFSRVPRGWVRVETVGPTDTQGRFMWIRNGVCTNSINTVHDNGQGRNFRGYFFNKLDFFNSFAVAVSRQSASGDGRYRLLTEFIRDDHSNDCDRATPIGNAGSGSWEVPSGLDEDFFRIVVQQKARLVARFTRWQTRGNAFRLSLHKDPFCSGSVATGGPNNPLDVEVNRGIYYLRTYTTNSAVFGTYSFDWHLEESRF